MKPPRVFISYAHESDEHADWVRKFAKLPRDKGIDALLDTWNSLGSDLNAFMEQCSAADRVLVICTPQYAAKANQRKGGVGVEGTILSARVYETLESDAVVPVLRSGEWKHSVPIFMKGRSGIDFRSDELIAAGFPRLLSDLYGRTFLPPLGEAPKELTEDYLAVPDAFFSDFKAPTKEEPPVTPQPIPKPGVAEDGISELVSAFGRATSAVPHSSTGCIMVVDISDFSKIGEGHREGLQKSAVAALTWFVHNHALPTLAAKVSGNASSEVFYMMTLDGCVIATRPNLYSDIVQIAFDWIDFMRRHPGQPIGLRVGLHKGDFFAITNGGSKEVDLGSRIFGTGPNDCDRIARIGDAGNVFASEQFLHDWKQQSRGRTYSPRTGRSLRSPSAGGRSQSVWCFGQLS